MAIVNCNSVAALYNIRQKFEITVDEEAGMKRLKTMLCYLTV